MIWFFVGLVIGMIIGWENKKSPVPDNTTENNKLMEEIAYYKDLCKWHVEEKEKLKRENYIK